MHMSGVPVYSVQKKSPILFLAMMSSWSFLKRAKEVESLINNKCLRFMGLDTCQSPEFQGFNPGGRDDFVVFYMLLIKKRGLNRVGIKAKEQAGT
jgi:hypothetical protein